jgi:hypothetical protein
VHACTHVACTILATAPSAQPGSTIHQAGVTQLLTATLEMVSVNLLHIICRHLPHLRTAVKPLVSW